MFPLLGEKFLLISYLKQKGFTVSEGASPLVLNAVGTVALTEKTFGILLNLYEQDSYTFYSTNSSPHSGEFRWFGLEYSRLKQLFVCQAFGKSVRTVCFCRPIVLKVLKSAILLPAFIQVDITVQEKPWLS